MQSIRVRHNIEVAHRLSLLPGKCENIHGHSMWVELEITGRVNQNGILLEFGPLKKEFREFLDTEFDHRLLLNVEDPLLHQGTPAMEPYPGLSVCVGDPTTENIAMWITTWAKNYIRNRLTRPFQITVSVQETPVNGATYSVEVV